jgi:hypothetical protein
MLGVYCCIAHTCLSVTDSFVLCRCVCRDYFAAATYGYNPVYSGAQPGYGAPPAAGAAAGVMAPVAGGVGGAFGYVDQGGYGSTYPSGYEAGSDASASSSSGVPFYGQ